MKAKPYYYIATAIVALIVTYVTGWLFLCMTGFSSPNDILNPLGTIFS